METAYKKLMVDAGPDLLAETRIRLAAELARHFRAQLIGLSACGVRPPTGPPFGADALVAEVIEAEIQRVSAMQHAAAGRFQMIAGAAGGSAEWRSFLEYSGDALAREARAADLVITGRGSDVDASGFRLTAEPGDVVMRAGRPVLVVPPGVAALEARRVLVAWTESREARRAVIDALPFLTRAERVVVLEVCDEEADLRHAQQHVEDVAAFLAAHGAKASGEAAVRGAPSTAAELLRAAKQLQADLIVSGAYGHARLLEWVFGGVTRDLLNTCPVCCLLSH